MTQAHGVDISATDKLVSQVNTVVNSVTSKDSNETAKNYRLLLKLNEEMRKLDETAKSFGEEINEKIKLDKVLTGDQVYLISKLVGLYHHMSIRMNEINSFSKPNPEQGFLVSHDPDRIKKDLMWLDSYLTLFKSYHQNYHYYYKNTKLRRMFKNILKTNEHKNIKTHELLTMISHVFEKDNIETVRSHLIEFSRFRSKKYFANDKIKNLSDEIQSSDAFLYIKSGKKVKIKNRFFVDNLMYIFGKITNAVSGMFGNLVGKVRWRHGFLYNNEEALTKINTVLKPLDILLEKTPFALTDSFIPGHFGHAAIYLGTEQQLKSSGLWFTETIKPYHEQISKGYVIIEAVRSGVRLTTLEHFMEIDDLMIMRANVLPMETAKALTIYNRAFDQLGKEYDFNFDVETTDKIVCSELIFFAFGKINWPTEYIFGRPTISPDNVAELIYFDNTPTSFTMNLWSNKNEILKEVSKDELGKKIGYVENETRSTNEVKSYDKKTVVCKRVIKRGLRSGSRRNRRIEVRVCRDRLERRVYRESKGIREKLYGHKQDVSNN